MSKYDDSAAKWLILFSVLAVLCIGGALLGRYVLQARRYARSMACLAHIGLALHQYHEVHGSFPPAYLADESGKPVHSWRVLVLPYLGYDELYERYDFSEPWDGPHNRLLAEELCDIYGSATGPHGKGTMASYLAVVGADTAWPGERSVRLEDFADGSSSTLVLLECPNSGVKWSEPRDLAYSDVVGSTVAGNRFVIASMRPDGVLCLLGDGTVHRLEHVSPDLLKGLVPQITIVSPPTPEFAHSLGSLPSFPSMSQGV